MKKAPSIFPLVTILIGLWSAHAAEVERAEHLSQPSYLLTEEQAIPDSWSVLSFQDQRPNLVEVSDTLLFLGPSGEVKNRFAKPLYARIFHSQNEYFIGIQEIVSSQVEPGAEKSISFRLYNQVGKELWSWKGTLSDDQLVPSFYLSNVGCVAVAMPTTGQIIFLNQEGSIERLVDLFPEAPIEMERPLACAFSDDGHRLAVNVLYRQPLPGDGMTPREKGRSYLILFDDNGEELWRQLLPGEISDQVVISSGGKTIAAGAYTVKGLDVAERKTYLYGVNGELLCELELPFQWAMFSPDGAQLLLSHKQNLWLVECTTGRILWKDSLPRETGQIRALDISPDGTLALVKAAPGRYFSRRFYYAPVHVILYNQQGDQVWKKTFPEDSFDRPMAHFLRDGSGFLLTFQNRYLIYDREP